MHYPNSMMNTIEDVLGWDLPDAALAGAVQAQLRAAAGED